MWATVWLRGCTPGVLLDADTRSNSRRCRSTSTAGASNGPQTSSWLTQQTCSWIASHYLVYSYDVVSFNTQQQLLGVIIQHARQMMNAGGGCGWGEDGTDCKWDTCVWSWSRPLVSHLTVIASTLSDRIWPELHNALRLANRRGMSN